MSITPHQVAEMVAVFGGAALTFSTIVYAIYRGASKAFAQGVTLHVAPLFDELKASLNTLNSTMTTVKHEHDAVVTRFNERLADHDDELTACATRVHVLGERTARLEGLTQ